MKKFIMPFLVLFLTCLFVSCDFFEKVTTLNYYDEENNLIASIPYKSSKGVSVTKTTVGNIEYAGYYINGILDLYVFADEQINDSSDVVLKTKWIESSFSEIPYRIRKNYDKAYYENHRIYRNKYNTEFYDRDSRTTWIASSTVTVY